MKCEDVQEWISLSLDGALESGHEAELDQHLEQCEACRHRQQAWATQVQLMQQIDVPEGPSPEAMWQSVRSDIQAWESSKAAMNRRALFQRGLYALAACLLVGVGLYFGLRSVTHDAPGPRNTVDYVETSIEGAMTMTWVDEESGITVIWVEEPNEDDDAG